MMRGSEEQREKIGQGPFIMQSVLCEEQCACVHLYIL